MEFRRYKIERMPPFSHEKGFCHVSEKYKLIFLPIPKNASTSIRNIQEFNFRLDNIFRYLHKIEIGAYRVFTIFRNPLDRFVSAYIEVCERAYGDSTKTLKRDFYWIKDQKKRFYTFISEAEDSFFNPHIRPQSYFITDYNNNLLMIDSILNFHTLEESFSQMLNKYGLNSIKIPKRNIRSRTDKNKLENFKYLIIQIFHTFKKLISGKNCDIYKRKELYLFLDKAVRFFQRRPLPNKAEVFQMIDEDKSIIDRINELYHDDWILYEKFKKAGYLY